MSIPEFTPPTHEQLHAWARRATNVEEDCLDAARWGFDQAVAQMPTWPEPITDRNPTEQDADIWNDVLWLIDGASWEIASWSRYLDTPWLPTPPVPRKPDPRQQALADLATLSGSPEAIERIRQVLEGGNA